MQLRLDNRYGKIVAYYFFMLIASTWRCSRDLETNLYPVYSFLYSQNADFTPIIHELFEVVKRAFYRNDISKYIKIQWSYFLIPNIFSDLSTLH